MPYFMALALRPQYSRTTRVQVKLIWEVTENQTESAIEPGWDAPAKCFFCIAQMRNYIKQEQQKYPFPVYVSVFIRPVPGKRLY